LINFNLFDTPIALIAFNRPETTKRVLDSIRKVKPKKLFIIADAPRLNHANDLDNCNAVKKLIDSEVDWDCSIYKRYPEENLGCGKGPSSGISWVFEHVDRCIILEDDCLPVQSFFTFCEELLEKYNNDTRVMMISGNHHLFEEIPFEYSYCFSRHTQTWGWATWKRAWDLYDYEMKLWPTIKNSDILPQIIGNGLSAKRWTQLFDKCYLDKNRDYWDFQWTFACLAHNALNIIPDKNMVSNIGFGESAGTHFSDLSSPFANLPSYEMTFPILHPSLMVQDLEVDNQINNDVYGHISFYKRIKRKFNSLFKS